MSEATDCLICNRIASICAGSNPYFVAEVETGYIVLGDYQFFSWIYPSLMQIPCIGTS